MILGNFPGKGNMKQKGDRLLTSRSSHLSGAKLIYLDVLKWFLQSCVFMGLLTPAWGHDEALYGKALSYQKVEGVGPCIAAEVVGTRLYAIGQGMLSVLDISEPEKPVIMGTLQGLGNTRQLVIHGDTAYIASRQDGLWMVDVSVDSKPTLISHYDTVEMATGIWISGDVGFIATRCYGVEVVDVSNPRQVKHLSTLKTGEAQSCWARDRKLYIGDWAPKKLLIADVSDPRAPTLIGEGELDGYGDGGCLRGNYCFAATGHHSRSDDKIKTQGHGHGLEIFDVSKAESPVLVSRVKFPPMFHLQNDFWTARVAGDHCVVADTHNGLFVVNVRDVSKPSIVAHAELPWLEKQKERDSVGGVALGKGVIYAAGVYSGLYVVAAPGMAEPVQPEKDLAPTLGKVETMATEDPDFQIYQPNSQVHSVSVQGDIAWAACGAGGIQAIQLGAKLEPLSVHSTVSHVWHVSVAGKKLFSAEGPAGMAIYDIGEDLRLQEVGRLKIPGASVKQIVAPAPSHYALLHCGGPSVYVVDLTDAKKPKVILKDSQVGLFYGDQLVDELFDGRYLCAHWHRSGPGWYDVQGGSAILAGNTPDTSNYSWTDGACAFGQKLLIVKRGKYAILNANEKRLASELPQYGVKGLYLFGRPSAGGETLVVTSRHQRTIQILDISDITQPRLKHSYSVSGHPGAAAFWQGRAVIPAGYQGLLVEKKQP